MKRDWRDELRLLVEVPCLLALACVGLLLIPFVGVKWVSDRPSDRPRRGGYYDHPEHR